VLLKNVDSDRHHWVELKLIGGTNPANGKSSPRDAIGATVYLTTNGIRGAQKQVDVAGAVQREDVMSGGSYISSNDQRPHFGLGDSTDAGTAEIHWPSGAIESVRLPAIDRIFTITEGKGITGVLCAKQPCATKPRRIPDHQAKPGRR